MPAGKNPVPTPEPFTRGEGLFLALIAAVFLSSAWRYVGLDFWYDEAFTLANYVFVPLGRTVTDYSFPNNHVLANLIDNLYLRLAGIHTLHRLMDMPWAIRLVPLAFSLGTVGWLYAAARRQFDRFTAQAAVAVLVTTLPFLNFCAQVRGFSLSMLLLTALLWESWGFERRPTVFRAALVVTLTALALYTIPLNLYFILSLAAFPLALRVLRRRGRHDERRLPWTDVLPALLAAGTVLAALLYAPVLGEVVSNRFVRSQGLFNTATLTGIMPRVLGYFVAPRHALWVVLAAAPAAWFLARRRGRTPPGRPLLACLVLLLGPFVLSFVRGDQPWLRVFVNLTPVFALLTAACLRTWLDAVPRLRRFAFPVLLGLLAYCAAMSWIGWRGIRARLLRDIETGTRSQDIFCNYYHAYFHPDRLTSRFARERDPQVPVVLDDVDWAALPEYLARHRVPSLGPDALDQALRRYGRTYVFSARAPEFLAYLRQRYPGFAARNLYPEPDFHSIFLVERGAAQ